ncbi:amidase domain-containing protein [Haloplasma contractile]|uniref:Amidase domain protein n=1 Tax=Haloplasma contractile SSD-17B TaxID=1033810 RepID=U2FPW7_9MOLU|nr:amidase domain-containing protein [Haloplasma contractile]ERJ13084.1 Putative amidase domain protein [Haloplasma contractile SSD-17B]
MIYNRKLAIEYALKYGENPNPDYKYFDIYGIDGGDCTNFISQCLKYGGIPMVYNKPAPWYYSNSNWSISWTLSHSLYWCLKIRQEKMLDGPRGIELNHYSELELGDLIFYKENGRNNHSAIITDFKDGYPLVSQHSVNAVNINYINEKKSDMLFMKIKS